MKISIVCVIKAVIIWIFCYFIVKLPWSLGFIFVLFDVGWMMPKSVHRLLQYWRKRPSSFRYKILEFSTIMSHLDLLRVRSYRLWDFYSIESVVKRWVIPSNIVEFLDSLYVWDVLWGIVDYRASKLYLDLFPL